MKNTSVTEQLAHHRVAHPAFFVLGGSALITLSANLAVPMYPVPMTLQTLTVLILGMTLGLRLGLATVVTWLAQGAVGFPVFAGGGSGASLVGPTAGFLFGFLAVVAIAGFAADRGTRGILSLSAVGVVASAALYLPGLAWPALVMGETMPELLAHWMLPFLAGDLLKAIIAAACVSFGWRLSSQG